MITAPGSSSFIEVINSVFSPPIYWAGYLAERRTTSNKQRICLPPVEGFGASPERVWLATLVKLRARELLSKKNLADLG